MRGLDLMDNFTQEDNRRAKECFEEAIRLNGVAIDSNVAAFRWDSTAYT